MHESFIFSKVQKFLRLQGSTLSRDCLRMQQMFSKKNFAAKAIENFQIESEELYEQCGARVLIDGLENFCNGIPLFTLYATFQNNFIVHEPVSANTYFGNDSRFFVNNGFIRLDERECKNIKVLDNEIIPSTLSVSWFLARLFDMVVIHEKHQILSFLQETPNVENKIFFHSYAKENLNFNKTVEKLIKN